MNTGLVAGSLISIGGSSIGGESNQNNPTINVNALAVAGLLIKNKIQPLGANGTDLNYYQSWVRMELYQSRNATEPINSKSAQIILRDGETNQWKSASLYWEGLDMPDDWCEGFVKIYIENQGDESIWFDDISVEHTHNPGKIEVVSYKDYYPFGAEMRGSCIDNQGRYGYQGDYAEKDEETGWNAFELRMYDPLIGRSTNVDPYRQYHSPYVWVGNNPMNMVDPDGGNSIPTIAQLEKAAGADLMSMAGANAITASSYVMILMDFDLRHPELKQGKRDYKENLEESNDEGWSRVMFWSSDNSSSSAGWQPNETGGGKVNHIDDVTDAGDSDLLYKAILEIRIHVFNDGVKEFATSEYSVHRYYTYNGKNVYARAGYNPDNETWAVKGDERNSEGYFNL